MELNFIYIENYGCTANKNNAEILAGLCREAGLDIISKPELADIIIVNTCIVKTPTEEKIRFRIKQLAKLNKPIIISGCFTSLTDLPFYFLANIKDTTKLLKQIEEETADKKKFSKKTKEVKLLLPKFTPDKQGITQISEGCLGNCNYCITRFAKGPLFSYPEEKIIENIKSDLSKGCKEIWITSQDNAAYGLDEDKKALPELLKKIIQLKGFFKLRIGMMNPNNLLPILNEIIEIYKDKKTYNFLHLPVQSGSNKILKAMNRKYTGKDFIKIIEEFKKQIPDITISTDIITGYLGETEKDWQETLELIKQTSPDILNITKFWPRKFTPLGSKKQGKQASKRAKQLMQLHLKLAEEKNKQFIGKIMIVLVYDKGWQGTFLSRDKNYRQVIVKTKEKLRNKFVKVKITEIKPHYLIAEPVNL